MGDGPAYNKYKSRQDIERDYFREWKRITLLGSKNLDRPLTLFTFLAFLPTWFKLYALPGPVRYLFFLLGRKMAAEWHVVHKKLVLEGVKLDRFLIKRANFGIDVLPRRLILFRYHYRISALENIKYRLALLAGKVYTPTVKPSAWEPYPEEEKLDPNEYDPTYDPWRAA